MGTHLVPNMGELVMKNEIYANLYTQVTVNFSIGKQGPSCRALPLVQALV